MTLAVAAANPALFGVILNQDGTVNSQSNPAARNTIVTLFGTGEGLGDGVNVTGMPAQAPYARAKLPVSLTIGAVPADLLYAGSAPGQVGELQINARVPGGFLLNGAAPVDLTVGAFTAGSLTVWVK
jgi:uncharacterized protein (TIGR03437 family)